MGKCACPTQLWTLSYFLSLRELAQNSWAAHVLFVVSFVEESEINESVINSGACVPHIGEMCHRKRFFVTVLK